MIDTLAPSTPDDRAATLLQAAAQASGLHPLHLCGRELMQWLVAGILPEPLAGSAA